MQKNKTETSNQEHTTQGLKFAIISTKWNQEIVAKLINGAKEALEFHGLNSTNYEEYFCNGALEIPLTADLLAKTGKYNAIIALGCVIKGDTFHFYIVSNESARGLIDVSLSTGVPCLNGILTVDNEQQAIDRTLGMESNKGYEVAIAAIEMANLIKKIN